MTVTVRNLTVTRREIKLVNCSYDKLNSFIRNWLHECYLAKAHLYENYKFILLL